MGWRVAETRVGVAASLVLLLVPAAGHAQAPGGGRGTGAGPSLRVTAFAAGSVRESPAGFGIARDVRSATLRLTLRRSGVHPFLQAGAFVRPDLACPAGVTCNGDGWTVRGGAILPFSLDDTRPGTHLYMIVGGGAAVSEESKFSYILGLGTSTTITPWLAPSVEVRWEDFPGIRNVLMVNLGLRVDPF